MCGIVGVLGKKGAAHIVRDGLIRLEYRGYDSAGIAWHDNGVHVVKDVGRVVDLPPVPSASETLAIGHTRWATHGGVTKANAHPHLDGTGRYAVVHNGTIAGFHALRARMLAEGHTLQSETDTELLVHLYEHHRSGKGPLEALQAMLQGLEGSWAMVLLDSKAQTLCFARNRAPLLVGLCDDGAILLASDATAVLAQTRRFVHLDDGDHGIADATGLRLFGADGKPKSPPITTVDWDVRQAEKAGYAHYMLKEIFEAPTALNQCLAGRIHLEPLSVDLDIDPQLLGRVRRIRLVGCGTSLHAAIMGRHFIESWAGIAAEAIPASEIKDRPILDAEGTLYVGVSQSGETYDTLEAMRHIQGAGLPVLAITNVQGSSLHRMADDTILLRVGPEVGVAATKTFLGQAAVLALLALGLALRTRQLPQHRLLEIARELDHLPRVLDGVLGKDKDIKELAGRLTGGHSLFFLGRGVHVATALEAALKFKEITYRHAEGFGAADLKHGPFALLDERTPCIFFESTGSAKGPIWSSVVEVQARGAPSHVIAQGVPDELLGAMDSVFQAPATEPSLAALSFSLAGQLLAYHAAALLGRPIDRPRNLAKSVTVE
ncbi:MAG TPA: glutamine--fructose-6-phosphate transaminase (isomerizing) [Candidatus Thermoplasmatota archaeon]|nr:glutamine--fructose-6-phosphate transaminase (isomerizing) [Candidatus Thermoplasmatota archaeon]